MTTILVDREHGLSDMAAEVLETLRVEGEVEHGRFDEFSLCEVFGYDNSRHGALCSALDELSERGLIVVRCDGQNIRDRRGKRRCGSVVRTYSAK